MKLSIWLEQNRKTVTWLAVQVGRDRSFISKVKNGDALPSIAVAAEIQRVTGGAVTATDYLASPPSASLPATVSPCV